MNSVKGYHVFAEDGSGHLTTVCRDHTPDENNPVNEGIFLEPLDQCEHDSPTHCEYPDCGVLLDHNLTDEGYEYVAKRLSAVAQSVIDYAVWAHETMSGKQQALSEELTKPEPKINTLSDTERLWYDEWRDYLTYADLSEAHVEILDRIT